MSTAGPVHRVQSAVEVYGYPQGHIGHMTPEEETALKEFKALLVEKGLYTPQSETDEYGTHDDATLLRFLRARRFVVLDAYQQFKDTEDWRNANQLDLLYKTIDLEQYDETRKLYPQWTGRRDRRGIPVYVFEVKHLNAKRMAEYEKSAGHTHTKAKIDGKTPAKLLRLFALYENLLRFVMPMCTALTDREHPATPITQSSNIVDISGVGLKQFWNLRGHMQDASTLATAHYPETLDRIFIIGAPAFFPTVWGWIKRWFDPITTSKIFIISHHEVQSTLRKFIDPANIPKKYGGELDYDFGDLPKLDPALKEFITWENSHTDFSRGPLYWHDRGDYIELEAVGSVDKKERGEMLCKMKKPALDHVYSHYSEKQNGEALAPTSSLIRPEMLRMPTEKDDIPLGQKDTEAPAALVPDAAPPAIQEPKIPHPTTDIKILDATGVVTAAEVGSDETSAGPKLQVVEAGKLVPASRPEPVSFVTAHDNLNTLSSSTSAENSTPETGGEMPLPNGSAKAPMRDADSAVGKAPEEGDITPKAATDETSIPPTAQELEHKLEKVESKGSSSRNSKRSSLKRKILGKLKS